MEAAPALTRASFAQEATEWSPIQRARRDDPIVAAISGNAGDRSSAGKVRQPLPRRRAARVAQFGSIEVREADLDPTIRPPDGADAKSIAVDDMPNHPGEAGSQLRQRRGAGIRMGGRGYKESEASCDDGERGQPARAAILHTP